MVGGDREGLGSLGWRWERRPIWTDPEEGGAGCRQRQGLACSPHPAPLSALRCWGCSWFPDSILSLFEASKDSAGPLDFGVRQTCFLPAVCHLKLCERGPVTEPVSRVSDSLSLTALTRTACDGPQREPGGRCAACVAYSSCSTPARGTPSLL